MSRIGRICRHSCRCLSPLNAVLHAGDPNSNWASFQEQKEAHVNLRLRLTGGEMIGLERAGHRTGVRNDLLHACLPFCVHLSAYQAHSELHCPQASHQNLLCSCLGVLQQIRPEKVKLLEVWCRAQSWRPSGPSWGRARS